MVTPSHTTGDGRVRRYALIINGDSAPHHQENVDLARADLTRQGYEVIVVSPDEYYEDGDAKTALAAIGKLTDGAMVDADDEVVVYVTGHGAIRDGEPGVVLSDRKLYASEFVTDIVRLPCETTVVMDECMSGSFATLFADDPTVRLITLSGKGLTDFCHPFAPRFWNPSKKADDDGDGVISWRERFDWATRESNVPEYSLSVYFTGAAIDEQPFDAAVISVATPDALDTLLAKPEAGLYTVVLFSAPWCDACQENKPAFHAQADGRYRFVIAENKDPSQFAPLDGRTPIPHLRLFGWGLPKEGIDLGQPNDIHRATRQTLSERDPEKRARRWLEKGSPNDQVAAVRVFAQTLPMNERTAFLIGIVDDATRPLAAQDMAISELMGIVKHRNWLSGAAETALHGRLENEELPLALRALIAARLLKHEEEWSHDEEKLALACRAVLMRALRDGELPNDPFTQFKAGSSVDVNDPELRQIARVAIAQRKPSAFVRGIVAANDAARAQFGRELIAMVFDNTIEPNLQKRLAGEDDLPWKDIDERARAIEAFMHSPHVPLKLRLARDRAFDFWGDTIRQNVSPRRAHHLVAQLFASAPVLTTEMFRFLDEHWMASEATPQENKQLATTIISRIETLRTSNDEKKLASSRLISLLSRVPFSGDVEYFSRLCSPETPEIIREEAIEEIPHREAFVPILVKLAESSDPDLRESAREAMWRHPRFDPFHLDPFNWKTYGPNSGKIVQRAMEKIHNVEDLETIAFDEDRTAQDKARIGALRNLASRFDALEPRLQQRILAKMRDRSTAMRVRVEIAFRLPSEIGVEWLEENMSRIPAKAIDEAEGLLDEIYNGNRARRNALRRIIQVMAAHPDEKVQESAAYYEDVYSETERPIDE